MKFLRGIAARIWSTIKKREFWFVVTIYPALYYLARFILSVLKKPVTDNPVYFGFITFFVFLIIIVSSVLEIITRKFKHELQGEKLRIREREGVDVFAGMNSDKK